MNDQSLREQLQTSETIKHGADEPSTFLTADVLSVFHEAAVDRGVWQQAVRNPHTFLESKGISIPDGIQIVLLEAPSTPTTRELNLPVWVECPEGLVPVLHREITKICTKAVEFWKKEIDPHTGEITGEVNMFHCVEMMTVIGQQWYCTVPGKV